MLTNREASKMPVPGDVIEMPGGIHFRVDRAVVSRDVVEGDPTPDGWATFRLDGRAAKVTLHGEVVTP